MTDKDTLTDPRLGRRIQEDKRNAHFPMSAMLQRRAYEEPKSKIWPCGPVLDQLQEGSCVGHGFAHQLTAFPFPMKSIAHNEAVKIYKKAQTLDEWPGVNYEGTSVLAGAKAVQELYPKGMESYRWANSLTDVIAVIGWHGPVVLGCNWYSGFYAPDAAGMIRLTGQNVGGHCLLIRGVDIKNNLLMLRNSWGANWGKKGNAWISFQDFERLLYEGADCCVPIPRAWWTS